MLKILFFMVLVSISYGIWLLSSGKQTKLGYYIVIIALAVGLLIIAYFAVQQNY